MKWSPLLTGAQRHEAWARVREITEALDRPYDEWALSLPDAESGVRSISLALGRCGVALFAGWAARAGIERGQAISRRFLEESIELLPDKTMDDSLYCGFSGVAWTTEHLLRISGEDPGDDPVAGIDEALVEFLENEDFHPAYDLLGGLAGLGVYALEREGRPLAGRIASLVLDRLEAMARPQSTGISWPSGSRTRRAVRDDAPADETYFNLGLSHGVPGVIGILSRFARIAELRPKALHLLEGAVDWFLLQRLPDGAGGAFPDYIVHDAAPEPARVAWCYGDPGVAAAMLAAARALDRSELGAEALRISHLAATRPLARTEVVDTGLCHGSAGLAHLYHRLHRATGDAPCADAAQQWFECCLERVTDRPAIAGFPTFSFDRKREGEFIEDPAWLTGAAGVGLALLAAITDQEPEWDRLLLLDLGG
jgi:lantibiotic modifying enzyme